MAQKRFTIKPPPNLTFRVVCVSDVGAGTIVEAAKIAYRMMNDLDGMPPVLDIVDNKGNTMRIDLRQRQQKGKHHV